MGDFLNATLQAYTVTAADFKQPASGLTVVVTVGSSSWMPIGLPVYIQGGGAYTVSARPSSTRVTLLNTGATGNAATNTVISSGALLAPGGGAAGGGGLTVNGSPSAGYVATWDGSQALWLPAGGLQILTFAPVVSLYECSQSVVSPAFTASYNVAPTTALLTNNANAESRDVHTTPTSFTSASSWTYSKSTPNQTVTWTLTTSNGTRTAVATWGQKNFWGVSGTPANTEAFIESLGNSQLATTRAANFTVSASAIKVYFACPTRYGTPVFTSGGFAGGFIQRATGITVTNAQGFAEGYDLYESSSSNLGTVTIGVS